MNNPRHTFPRPEIDHIAREVERLTVHTSLDGMVTDCPHMVLDRDEASDILNAFRAANWTNKLAHASIWSWREGRYLESWRGGITFGPHDTRHPIERIFARAIDSGAPVLLIDGARVTRFNQGRLAAASEGVGR